MTSRAVLAMDIGGTNIRMAVVSREGDILVRNQSPCRISDGATVFLESVKADLQLIKIKARAASIDIAAVGAGVPGLIDKAGIIISSVNLKPIDGLNFQYWLSNESGLPSIILNDANAAAIAEHRYGAGRAFCSVLHLTLGTGVGSGLILDGKIWTGFDGVASEFGHVTVEPDGILCQCGNYGCLEQYASATAIARYANSSVVMKEQSTLSALSPECLDASEVALAAHKGDAFAMECFSRAGRYIGIASAAAINMLNLEAIVLGGGVSESFDLLAPAIRREIDARAFSLPASRVKLLKGTLKDNAGIMGAAAAAFSSSSAV